MQELIYYSIQLECECPHGCWDHVLGQKFKALVEGMHVRKHVEQPNENDTVHDQQTQQMDIGRLDDEYTEGSQSNALEGSDGRNLQQQQHIQLQQQMQPSSRESEEMRGELMCESDAPPPSHEQSCYYRQVRRRAWNVRGGARDQID